MFCSRLKVPVSGASGGYSGLGTMQSLRFAANHFGPKSWGDITSRINAAPPTSMMRKAISLIHASRSPILRRVLINTKPDTSLPPSIALAAYKPPIDNPTRTAFDTCKSASNRCKSSTISASSSGVPGVNPLFACPRKLYAKVPKPASRRAGPTSTCHMLASPVIALTNTKVAASARLGASCS